MGNRLNDNDFGTRDKRGHWKPFGTISINPPKDIFFNPIKFLKYFFKLWHGIFGNMWCSILYSMFEYKKLKKGFIITGLVLFL